MGDKRYDDGENVVIRFHEIKSESPKAYLIALSPDDYHGTWIPKSQVANIDHEASEVWIPLWLAEKKGLDYD